MGKLFFDSENPTACDPYDLSKTTQNPMDQRIFIARRGGCTFVWKARQAEHAGAIMLILVDNLIEGAQEEFLLNDDGTGADIVIPTVMLSKDDGEQILSYMIKYPT